MHELMLAIECAFASETIKDYFHCCGEKHNSTV